MEGRFLDLTPIWLHDPRTVTRSNDSLDWGAAIIEPNFNNQAALAIRDVKVNVRCTFIEWNRSNFAWVFCGGAGWLLSPMECSFCLVLEPCASQCFVRQQILPKFEIVDKHPPYRHAQEANSNPLLSIAPMVNCWRF